MPSYNSSKFISETIQSVQAQTFSDWEIIIIEAVKKVMYCTEQVKKVMFSKDHKNYCGRRIGDRGHG